jgi:hypothetical protein
MNIHPTDAGFLDGLTDGRLPDTQTFVVMDSVKAGPRYGYEVFKPNALEPLYTSPAIYFSRASAFAASRNYLKANQGEVFA